MSKIRKRGISLNPVNFNFHLKLSFLEMLEQFFSYRKNNISSKLISMAALHLCQKCYYKFIATQ